MLFKFTPARLFSLSARNQTPVCAPCVRATRSPRRRQRTFPSRHPRLVYASISCRSTPPHMLRDCGRTAGSARWADDSRRCFPASCHDASSSASSARRCRQAAKEFLDRLHAMAAAPRVCRRDGIAGSRFFLATRAKNPAFVTFKPDAGFKLVVDDHLNVLGIQHFHMICGVNRPRVVRA